MTMGQAVDQAVKIHEDKYPDSKVYQADVRGLWGMRFVVEIRASNFSASLKYIVGGQK